MCSLIGENDRFRSNMRKKNVKIQDILLKPAQSRGTDMPGGMRKE